MLGTMQRWLWPDRPQEMRHDLSDAGDDTPLRVLHVKGSLDRSMGGSVTALVGVAVATEKAGDRPEILATRQPDDDLGMLTALSPDVSVHLPRRSWPYVYYFSWGLLPWLWRNITRYDLVEVHEVYAFPTFATWLACRLRGVPFVLHPHSSLDPYDMRKHARLKRLLAPVVRRMLRGTAAVWLTTEEESRRLDDHGVTVRRVVSVLPVEPDEAAGSRDRFRQQHGIGADDFAFLFMGRLDRKKRVPQTVAAFDRVADEHLWLVIAGSGDAATEDEVRQAVARARHRDRILLLGYVSGADRADAMAGSDAFVLVSDNENFGIAPIEAAHAGLPLLLSEDVYIAPVLVDAGVAAVIETEDDAALDRWLTDLASRGDAWTRLRDAARSADLPFGWDSVAATDAGVRRQVLAGVGRLPTLTTKG